MGLVQLLVAFRASRQIESLARELAQQKREEVLARVQQRRVQLNSMAEARGYVRAHCSGLVAALVDALMARHALPASSRNSFTSRATESLVELVAYDLFSVRPALVVQRRAG